jgi:hypothetical protein
LPEKSNACRRGDFGFGDRDDNAAAELPRRSKSIVTVEFDPMNGEAMSELRNIQGMLAEAERAASTGDLVSAEELLRDVAQIQTTELGPLHPALANTLNNLAIVSEKRGRPHDAEAFYRQAVEIASASLAPDDPMVIASRQNLEDFRRAQGLVAEKPAVIALARAEAPAPSTPTEPLPSLAASRNALRAAPVSAVGIAALVIALFLMGRPRTTPPESTTVPAAEPVPAADSAPPAHAPIDRTPSPAPTVEPALAPVAIALANAQLCRNFSRRDWRCVPAGDSVAPGTIVLYTSVRSARGGVIVYRWYQGDELRSSTQTRIGANVADGYRTYSGQKVNPGDWRVEVRSTGGDLLHEERFEVR